MRTNHKESENAIESEISQANKAKLNFDKSLSFRAPGAKLFIMGANFKENCKLSWGPGEQYWYS